MTRRAASSEVVAARTAVTRALADLAPGDRVVVACSGGPDSLALAGATAWVCDRRGLRASAVIVDHGLQDGSAAVAAEAERTCRELGLVAEIVRVEVGTVGGPEAAAREARYGALEQSAADRGARAVLLGHTREDQAETVLLRLTRGSGARSLAAMSVESGLWRRPFLGLTRADVRNAAESMLEPLGRAPWADPHNEDRSYARVRVRTLLDELVSDLGPGVVLGLTRTADLLRDDADALEAIADAAFTDRVAADEQGVSAACDELAALPAAIRTRVIRLMALACGSPPDALGFDHVRQVDGLVADWHGQGAARLPGGVVAERRCGRLCLRSAGAETGVAGGT